jgi:CRP-like cAMP-binding protein
MNQKLAEFSLLAELIPADRRALAEFLTARELDAGSALFRASEEAEELFFITDGSLSVRLEGQTIASLGGSEVLGALCLMNAGLRMCDAIATEPTHVLCLSRESYSRLRADQPALALKLEEAVLRSFASLVRNILVDGRAPIAGFS